MGCEVSLGDAMEAVVGSPGGVDGGGVGGLQVGVDVADGLAPGFDWAEDGVGRVVLGYLVVALAVLLVNELDGDGVAVVEAWIEVGEDGVAKPERNAPHLDGLCALCFYLGRLGVFVATEGEEDGFDEEEGGGLVVCGAEEGGFVDFPEDQR